MAIALVVRHEALAAVRAQTDDLKTGVQRGDVIPVEDVLDVQFPVRVKQHLDRSQVTQRAVAEHLIQPVGKLAKVLESGGVVSLNVAKIAPLYVSTRARGRP